MLPVNLTRRLFMRVAVPGTWRRCTESWLCKTGKLRCISKIVNIEFLICCALASNFCLTENFRSSTPVPFQSDVQYWIGSSCLGQGIITIAPINERKERGTYEKVLGASFGIQLFWPGITPDLRTMPATDMYRYGNMFQMH